jgi:hypothetical protein
MPVLNVPPGQSATFVLPPGASWIAAGVGLQGHPTGGTPLNLNGNNTSSISIPVSALAAAGYNMFAASWKDSSGAHGSVYGIQGEIVLPHVLTLRV